jgi:hypothetical protein
VDTIRSVHSGGHYPVSGTLSGCSSGCLSGALRAEERERFRRSIGPSVEDVAVEAAGDVGVSVAGRRAAVMRRLNSVSRTRAETGTSGFVWDGNTSPFLGQPMAM